MAHRTQDDELDRLSMVIGIEVSDSIYTRANALGEKEKSTPKKSTEDVKCAAWAAGGECDAQPEFMGCVCAEACAEAGEFARAQHYRRDHDEL